MLPGEMKAFCEACDEMAHSDCLLGKKKDCSEAINDLDAPTGLPWEKKAVSQANDDLVYSGSLLGDKTTILLSPIDSAPTATWSFCVYFGTDT